MRYPCGSDAAFFVSSSSLIQGVSAEHFRFGIAKWGALSSRFRSLPEDPTGGGGGGIDGSGNPRAGAVRPWSRRDREPPIFGFTNFTLGLDAPERILDDPSFDGVAFGVSEYTGA
mmetsp:Transcript_12427/g.23789  ORF Transcript_12427/g.23789 Transcript_12427/m.23789 type:complete len:115 (-) Transcript_12427:231-575(-)